MHTLIKKHRKYFNYLPVVIICTALLGTAILQSCGSNIFSVQDDVDMGKEIDAQIRNESTQYPIMKGHQDIKDYVSDLGRYVLNTSKAIEYKNVFPYKFEVIHDDSTINAFCIPGGFIYVYTGLMKFLDNEAALTGVIAHEIAHAERRHMTQRLTSYYGVSMILGLALGSNPNVLADIAANLFVGLGFLANSRADEEEADNYSIKYLTGSKYYPGAIRFFFDKIKEQQKKKGETPGDLERMLATHPLPQDRINNVISKLNKIRPKPDPTKGLYEEEYQNMKKKLP